MFPDEEPTPQPFDMQDRAHQISNILDALSIKADYLHIAAIAFILDEQTQVLAKNFIFSDQSLLTRNHRGAYIIVARPQHGFAYESTNSKHTKENAT